MIQNCDIALNMFVKDGVNLNIISGKDINENNEKVILDLIWPLILHYYICPSVNSESIKENEREKNYDQKSKNIKETLKSWAIIEFQIIQISI